MPKASKSDNAKEPVVEQVSDESPEVKAPPIEIPQSITVRELANLLQVDAIQIIKQLMRNSIMANINQAIAYEAAAAVVTEMLVAGCCTLPHGLVIAVTLCPASNV